MERSFEILSSNRLGSKRWSGFGLSSLEPVELSGFSSFDLCRKIDTRGILVFWTMKMSSRRLVSGNDMRNLFENVVASVTKSSVSLLYSLRSTSSSLFDGRAHEIYNNEMERKIKFLMRKNRTNPWPWNWGFCSNTFSFSFSVLFLLSNIFPLPALSMDIVGKKQLALLLDIAPHEHTEIPNSLVSLSDKRTTWDSYKAFEVTFWPCFAIDLTMISINRSRASDPFSVSTMELWRHCCVRLSRVVLLAFLASIGLTLLILGCALSQ